MFSQKIRKQPSTLLPVTFPSVVELLKTRRHSITLTSFMKPSFSHPQPCSSLECKCHQGPEGPSLCPLDAHLTCGLPARPAAPARALPALAAQGCGDWACAPGGGTCRCPSSGTRRTARARASSGACRGWTSSAAGGGCTGTAGAVAAERERAEGRGGTRGPQSRAGSGVLRRQSWPGGQCRLTFPSFNCLTNVVLWCSTSSPSSVPLASI